VVGGRNDDDDEDDDELISYAKFNDIFCAQFTTHSIVAVW
jgi:hypothetical protein